MFDAASPFGDDYYEEEDPPPPDDEEDPPFDDEGQPPDDGALCVAVLLHDTGFCFAHYTDFPLDMDDAPSFSEDFSDEGTHCATIFF